MSKPDASLVNRSLLRSSALQSSYVDDFISLPVNAANPAGNPPMIAVTRNRSDVVFVGNIRATFSVRIDCVWISIKSAEESHSRATATKPAANAVHPFFPKMKPPANAPITRVHQGRKY